MNFKTVLISIFVFTTGVLHAQLFKTSNNFSNLNGSATALTVKDSFLFIGGGLTSGNKVFTDQTNKRGVIIFDTDSPQKIVKIFNADATTTITDYIADGAGGYYLSGFFGIFDGVNISRTAIVRIKRDLSVVSSTIIFNGNIQNLNLVRDRIIVNGTFTYVGVYSMLKIAALDTNNLNLITGFHPSFTNATYQIVKVYKSNIYSKEVLVANGSFTTGSNTYSFILLDADNGSIITVYNNLPFSVNSCVIWKDIIFLTSNGIINNPVKHGYLYAFNLVTSSLSTTYNIKYSSFLSAINIDQDNLYLSSIKTSNTDTLEINGVKTPNQGIVTVDLNNLISLSLPKQRFPTDYLMYYIRTKDNKIFRTGLLNRINGFDHSNLSVTDEASNTVLNPGFPMYNTSPLKVELSGNTGLVTYDQGIDFDPHFGAGILNMKSMKMLDFNPKFSTDAIINTIKAVDSLVFIGGQFNVVDGRSVSNFAAFNYYTNALDTSINLNFNSSVNTLEFLNDSILLIGGAFTSMNGNNANYYVPYNFRKKAVSTSFNANFDQLLTMICKLDTQLFFAGAFSTVNNSSKSFLITAKVTGQNFDFDYSSFQSAIYPIHKVVIHNNNLFFTSFYAIDTNVLVYSYNGERINNQTFRLTSLNDNIPFGKFMVYGGSFSSFAGTAGLKNLFIGKTYNSSPTPDPSIINFATTVSKMASWGDSVVYFFSGSKLNKIVVSPDIFIAAPGAYFEYTCKKSYSVPYLTNGNYNAGNKFILEASTSTTFAIKVTLGQVTSVAQTGFINADFTPLLNGSSYYYRIVSTDPAIIGAPSLTSLFKKSIGNITLVQADTNCLAYSYASYTLSFNGVTNQLNATDYLIWNSSEAYYSNFSNKFIVKWKDGPFGIIKIFPKDANKCNLDTFIINVKIEKSPYNGLTNALENAVEVYPSIFENYLKIDNPLLHPLSYMLFDTNGKMIIEGHTSSTSTLATSSISPGFYTLLLKDEEQSRYIKLIRK